MDATVGAIVDPDFLSGEGGTVSHPLWAEARDRALDLGLLPTRRRLRAAAALAPPARRVLALGVVRADLPGLMAETRAELAASRHHVELHTTEAEDRGKFPNLNRLLEEHPAAGFDWVLVVDDDVRLPPGFLDTFLFLADALGLLIAQPAHRRRSHASWPVTRRRPRALARRTRFVEIGPVTAFAAPTFDVLLPFPDLRWGWGLDGHWAAIAAREHWPMGVIDATPVRHGLRPVGSTYSSADAVKEAETFLSERPYLPAREAARTLSIITQVPGSLDQPAR